jgi:nicotinamidase/pyrazinamidase
MTRALLVVDVQNDFCEGGALAVQGGNRVAEKIAFMLQEKKLGFPYEYDLTVASLDWHKPLPDTNCGHFAVDAEPDFVRSWPVHCVEYTDGAQPHPALDKFSDTFDFAVYKGNGTQSYSAFEGVTRTKDRSSLLSRLRSADVTDLDVVGIATDYCVKASVLDALGTGFNVRVLMDMCAGVSVETTAQACEEMMKQGAELVTGV